MKPAGRRVSGEMVATYGFNVPCRRFLITSNIARDRRLPMVDEFVLRLLKLGERVAASRIGAFFGFSTNETFTVLADLKRRGLVDIVGEDVELTASAHELFLPGRDGPPQMVEVETWVDRIWFDLVSRNMMTPERTRPLDHLIDLKPLATSKEIPARFAREAFEQNFTDFLKGIRRINNPDRYSLYSVSDVSPDRFGSVVVSGGMELQLDPAPRLVPRLMEADAVESSKFKLLTEAMHNAILGLTHAEPTQSGLAEFRRLTGDQSLTAHHNGGPFLSVEAWLADPTLQASSRATIVGAAYTERNITNFIRAVERRGLTRLKGRPPRALELRWYRPGGSSWGASQDIQHVVPALAAVVRKGLSTPCTIRSTIVTPVSARKDTVGKFTRLFDRGLCSPPSHLASTTEVLVVEGVAAMVLTRAALSKTVDIPVGLILTNEADLRRLDAGLKSALSGAEYDGLWHRAAVEEDRGTVAEA